jgi:pilus assembly protein CpaC
MRKTLLKNSSILILMAIVGASLCLRASAQEKMDGPQAPAESSQEVINLITGEVHSIDTKNLSRVAVANPETIDISDAKPARVFIAGKKAGQTELFIWDENGKHDYIVRVATENLDTVKVRVQDIIDRAQIKGISLEENPYEGKVVLYGSVTKSDKDTLDKIMDPYLDKTINLVKTEVNEDSVQIDAQIIEISTSLDKTLGIDWSDLTTSGSSGGTSSGTSGTPPLQPSYSETLPSFNGKIEDFFKIGNFQRQTPFQATLNVIINEGKGRVLSKPRLVVKSGKEASFLVGGEIPITTTSTSGGGAGTVTSSVEFKQYGVNMQVTPTVRDGKIDVNLNVKITDIDQSNKVGTNVAYTSREAQTQLFLEDKQTIVLAGLVKHNDGNTVRKVAFLGDVPILGALFRSRNTPATDTELVIVLTPSILKTVKKATEQTVFPSARQTELLKEVDSNFSKESIKDQPKPPEVKPVPPPVAPKVVTKMSKPIVMSASKVPDIAVLSYMRNVQLKISQGVSYPYEALQKNWEGTVKLRLRILRDGSLADCDLLESSGHDIFDSNALSTAKTIAPFFPFPAEIKQEDMVVTVPIVYHQSNNQKDTQTVIASY